LSEIQGISYRENGEIIDNPEGPYLTPDEIPIPAYDMLDMEKYAYVVLMCTRGCPHNCTFCELPQVHGKGIRCRSSERVSQELELALSLNPNLEIRYEDEFMGLFPERTKQILDLVKNKKVSQFRAATRPDGLTDEILLKLKEAGCSNLYIGMESGSDEVLKFNKRAVTVAKILEIAEMFKRNEMLFHAGFILGLPGETKETLEQTLSIIKPDAVGQNMIGNIIEYFERDGLSVTAAKMLHLSDAQAKSFYEMHKERPFYQELVEFMTSGPVLVMVLEGADAISRNRQIMGETDPTKAAPGTVRADFATSIERNAVHGSDSKETAKTEIAFFFKQDEIYPRT